MEGKTSKLIEALKLEGLEIGKPVEIKSDPVRTREVEEFIKKEQELSKITRNHSIHFGYQFTEIPLTNFY